MKKKFSFLTVVALMMILATLALSLVACGNKETDNKDDVEKEPVPVEYTVTFNTNGGSEIASVKVTENGLVKRPADPVKAKHVLENWYSDKECTTVFDFATSKITKDTTVYAKWTYVPDKFIVSFNTDGGTTIKSIAVEENKTVVMPTEVPVKEKHKFEGWFDKTLTTPFDFENTKITADTVIYAKWTYVPTENNISYPAGDLFVVPAEGVHVVEGRDFTLAVPSFVELDVKDGKNMVKTKDNQYNKFLGWYTESGVKLTDETGKSVKNWEDGIGDIVAVPRFETVDLLTFKLRADGDKTTYEVAAKEDIKFMRAIYVPASYEGKAVTKVGILGILVADSYSWGTFVDWSSTKLPENLELLSIPNTVNYIDKNAYALDDAMELKVAGGKLKRFEVIEGMEGTTPYLTCEDGVLFCDDGTTLFRYPVANAGVDGVYTVPNTVTKIADYAFLDYAYVTWESKWCGQLTKVILPADITHIGKHAFQKRHLLETIEFTDKSDVQLVIDDYAFNSTPIKSFVIPGNKSTLPDNIVSIGEYAFASIAGYDDMLMIEDIVLPNGLVTIGANAFNYLSEYEMIDGAVVYRKGIKSVFIPKTVTSIGNGAFASCGRLTKVTFEDGINLKAISDECFAYSGVETIVLPDSVESIGKEAFVKSQNAGEPIKSINIPANCKSIAADAFDKCYMVSITIDSQQALDNFAALKIEARTETVLIKAGLTVPDGLKTILDTMTKTEKDGYAVYTKAVA